MRPLEKIGRAHQLGASEGHTPAPGTWIHGPPVTSHDARLQTNVNVLQRIRGDEKSVVERCALCDFSVSAPLEEARQAFEGHECARPTRTVRRRGFGPRQPVVEVGTPPAPAGRGF
jgi:hypothetical protein